MYENVLCFFVLITQIIFLLHSRRLLKNVNGATTTSLEKMAAAKKGVVCANSTFLWVGCILGAHADLCAFYCAGLSLDRFNRHRFVSRSPFPHCLFSFTLYAAEKVVKCLDKSAVLESFGILILIKNKKWGWFVP